MTSDDNGYSRDVPFRPVGMGMAINFRCMGCGQTRLALGARGIGVRKRCAPCVEVRSIQSTAREQRT